MQQSVGQRPVTAPVVIGLLLVGIGVAALALRTAGINIFGTVAAWGWPMFVIFPGVLLLGASVIPARPNGVGFAIAGSIVTAVGLILAYQSQTDHWESWAYVWALIPAAAGIAQVVYGTWAAEGAMVRRGIWMVAVAGSLLLAGAWFFEGLFAGEPRVDQLEWGPVGLIVVGGIVLVGAFLRSSEPPRDHAHPA